MLGYLSQTRVLRLAGLFTWVMLGLPLVYSQYEALVRRGGGLDLPTVLLFVAYLAFGGGYLWLTRGRRDGSG